MPTAASASPDFPPDPAAEDLHAGIAGGELRLRNAAIAGASGFVIAAYGNRVWWWEGFGGGFKTTNEAWFGARTEYGGADKLGHAFSNYAGVRLLTPLYAAVGNTQAASVRLAAWTTLGIYTAIEVVDGYSRRWRFSREDSIANTAGALLGVLLETHPRLDAIVDFRLDYRRSPQARGYDFPGDYSGQKYLVVIKADGFESLRNSPLRHVELAAGYGTRGYENWGERHRDLYLGVSLNLARVLADAAYGGRTHSTPFQRGTDRVFELVQFPTVTYAHRGLSAQ